MGIAGQIINGVEWLDEFTFRTPSGKIYRYALGNGLGESHTCAKCAIVDHDNSDHCGLDTDPEFAKLSCWQGAEDEGISFYYFVDITSEPTND